MTDNNADPTERREMDVAKVEEAKSATTRRPSDQLVSLHLRQLVPSQFGLDWRTQLANGNVDLYNRLKVRDPIDSMYATSIVALYTATMSEFAAAARGGKDHQDSFDRACEGMERFVELITTYENRRALQGDRLNRESAIRVLVKRYGWDGPEVTDKGKA